MTVKPDPIQGKGVRRLLFGSARRRLISFLITNALFYLGALPLHRYIDFDATSPLFALFLMAFWMTLGFVAALCTLVFIGDRVLSAGFTKRFLKDEWDELDKQIEASAARGAGQIVEPEEEDEEEELAVPTKDSHLRVWILFFIIAAANLLISNTISGGFLQRLTHPGIALIYMRSDEAASRRQGLDMLASKLNFKPTPQVEAALQKALTDSDEGVQARAAHVAGCLGVESALDALEKMATTQPALSFAAMIAIGQIGGAKAQETATRVAATENAQAEPTALVFMIGLTRIPLFEQLRKWDHAEDPQLRAAAIWAMGELKEPRLLSVFEEALDDPELIVRCAAVQSIEFLRVFESSQALQKAWDKATDPLAICPILTVPVQEGGPKRVVLPYRNYQLALVRALSTTDDPDLIPWFEAHQDNITYETHHLMEAAWKRLKERDARGELNLHRQRNRLRRLQERQQADPSNAQ